MTSEDISLLGGKNPSLTQTQKDLNSYIKAIQKFISE